MIDELQVHPVAALFPMLPDDELDDMAADIRERGLLQPIVLSEDGSTLVDGRNRLEACRRAEVEPEFVRLNGEDPVGFILASNIHRRHMKAGQRAMVAARVRVISTQPVRAAAVTSGSSYSSVSHANVVLEWASELADEVVIGATPLDYAYQIAQDRKRAAESKTAQMDRLQRTAPDLAQLVVEERMALTEALAAERDRQERDRQHRQVTSRLVSEALRLLDPGAEEPGELARRLDEATDTQLPDKTELTRERLMSAAAVLKAWIKYLPGRTVR